MVDFSVCLKHSTMYFITNTDIFFSASDEVMNYERFINKILKNTLKIKRRERKEPDKMLENFLLIWQQKGYPCW